MDNDRFDRLTLGGDGLAPPEQGGQQAGGVRKQRSHRFTVPVSPPRSGSSSQLPPLPTSSPSSFIPSHNPLPYLPPPPPVQTQSIPGVTSFYSSHANGIAGGTGRQYDSAEDSPELNRHSPAAGGGGGREGRNDDGFGDEDPVPTPYLGGGSGFSQPSQPTQQHQGFSQQQQQQQQYQQYRPHPPSEFLAPMGANGYGGGAGRVTSPALSGGSSGGGSKVGMGAGGEGKKMVNEDGDEIIETAIVIKSIPFSAQKEELLAAMADLHLPPPFAFNFHYDVSSHPSSHPSHHLSSSSQQPQFRGLAFANYSSYPEAALTVSALNGYTFQGRKLRAEFKKALKPGEKERIERDKAVRRMRSAQMLAHSHPHGQGQGGQGGGGYEMGPPQGWNRREASAPGGYPGYAPLPVPPMPQHYGQGHGQYGGGGGLAPPLPQFSYPSSAHGQGEEEDYGRPLSSLSGPGSVFSSVGLSPAPSSLGSGSGSNLGARSFGAREFVPAGGAPYAYQQHHQQPHYPSHAPPPPPPLAHPLPHSAMQAPGMDFSYSSSPPSSDVGTSVSQRIGAAVTAETSLSSSEEGGLRIEQGEGEMGEGEGEGESMVGGGGLEELDLNNPTTLDIYSRVLLFRDDPLRDSLAFARALSPQQRRVVHLVAKKLGLEHRSVGGDAEGGAGRYAVVWKKGAEPVEVQVARSAGAAGGGGGGGGVRRLRHAASTASALRRAPSFTYDAPSPHPSHHPSSSSSFYPPASPSRSPAPPSHSGSRPTSTYLLSPSRPSSSMVKKSMPDLRYSRDGHILPSSSSPYALPPSDAPHYSSDSPSRSASPATSLSRPSASRVPSSSGGGGGLSQSTSLAANLAAYSAGVGFVGLSSSSSPSQNQQHRTAQEQRESVKEQAMKRRSYASLRSAGAGWGEGGGGGGRDEGRFATIAGGSPARRRGEGRETGSVMGVFQSAGIAPSGQEGKKGGGKAEATRQPRGPDVVLSPRLGESTEEGKGEGGKAGRSEGEWRKRP
ncbi:hypothetical protein JCM8547_000010 [Rhodosporidiobolus lusitaniae]